jgi:hypothetical protein
VKFVAKAKSLVSQEVVKCNCSLCSKVGACLFHTFMFT